MIKTKKNVISVKDFYRPPYYCLCMIKLLQKGEYVLGETKNQTKILTLDDKKIFAWIYATEIGEILVALSKKQSIDHTLSKGKYRLYEVKDEARLMDLVHLELLAGEGKWQGYLLPTGLPHTKDKRNRIIPTDELITLCTN